MGIQVGTLAGIPGGTLGGTFRRFFCGFPRSVFDGTLTGIQVGIPVATGELTTYTPKVISGGISRRISGGAFWGVSGETSGMTISRTSTGNFNETAIGIPDLTPGELHN